MSFLCPSLFGVVISREGEAADGKENRVKKAIAFAKPYDPDAFLAVGEFVLMNVGKSLS